MKVRSYKNDIEKLKEAGSSFVRQSAETKMIYRATIVNMYLNGISTKALSEVRVQQQSIFGLSLLMNKDFKP